MASKKDPKDMTIKEFMVWYQEEFDGSVNPSHYQEAYKFLSGFNAGFGQNDEIGTITNRLLDARNLLDTIWRYAK